MLLAYPTKNGIGISIYGDLGDLSSLYETVHDVTSTLDENNKLHKGQHQLLMNFAYEIRKAYSGQRLTDKVQFIDSKQKINYYGFNVVWTDILLFIAALRKNIDTNKLNQSNIFLLEYIVENALVALDEKSAVDIKLYLQNGIKTNNEYIFLLYQSMHIEFVSDKSKKIRINKILKLFQRHFAEGSLAYIEIINAFDKIAIEEGCSVSELEFENFPEIEW